jgi:SHS2 domain-containing protein
MRAFEILEHTADTGFRAFGRDLRQLFENAAIALESIALEPDNVEPRNSWPLSAAGEDSESLLVNWLNEVVYHLDGKRVAIARVRVEELTETAVAGTAWGEPRDPQRHPPRLVVKAATYHQLRLCEMNGGWVAEVYLDV